MRALAQTVLITIRSEPGQWTTQSLADDLDVTHDAMEKCVYRHRLAGRVTPQEARKLVEVCPPARGRASKAAVEAVWRALDTEVRFAHSLALRLSEITGLPRHAVQRALTHLRRCGALSRHGALFPAEIPAA